MHELTSIRSRAAAASLSPSTSIRSRAADGNSSPLGSRGLAVKAAAVKPEGASLKNRDHVFRESRHQCLIRSIIVIITMFCLGVLGYVGTTRVARAHVHRADRFAAVPTQALSGNMHAVVAVVAGAIAIEKAARERDIQLLETRIGALARPSESAHSASMADIQSLEARMRAALEKPRASERSAANTWQTYMDDKSAEQVAKNLAMIRNGNATVFILRIQKAGSSATARLFGMMPFPSAESKRLKRASPACAVLADCEERTRQVDIGLKLGSEECADRSHLMHYGHAKGEANRAAASRVFDGPLRRTNRIDTPMSDCIPFVYSYSIVERYRLRMSAMEKRVVHGYMSHARMVSGHFKYGIHALGHSGSYTYVTALRDPIRRVLSQWNWWCSRPERKMVHASTFHQWINHKMTHSDPSYGHYMLSNHMTRVVCGRSRGKARPGIELKFEEEGLGIGEVAPVTRAHLECAKRNLLKDFTLVIVLEMLREEPGLVEELRVMIAEMMLNIPSEWISDDAANTHATPMDAASNQVKKSDLSITAVMKLQEQNTLDFELHDFGRKLFTEQIKEWRRVFKTYAKSSA